MCAKRDRDTRHCCCGSPASPGCSTCGWVAHTPPLPLRTSRPRIAVMQHDVSPRIHLRVGRPSLRKMAGRSVSTDPPAGGSPILHCYPCGLSLSVCARLNHALRNNLGPVYLDAIAHRPSYQSGSSSPRCNSRQRRTRMGRIRSAANPRRSK